ncbi:MAG: DUF2723 domain-containing protein [Elusimicrobia bacterium]|nr:DUF2723 domain-containing protein [Elusimicrobiota bacterium]
MKPAAAVFGAFFWLYLWCMPPGLPLYRDSGEMTTSAATLGVSHPTGYPLYILLGRAVQNLPLGNRAYRMDLLSAAAGAACLALLFWVVRRRWGAAAGCGAALFLGLDPVFWSVCMVPEMYSLWMLLSSLILCLAWSLRERYSERVWLGFCFLYGLALTNRMDLVLWAPGMLWMALGPAEDPPRTSGLWLGLALVCCPALMAVTDSKALIGLLIAATALWRAPEPSSRWRWALASAGFGLLGLSLVLYLPVRSAGLPWLDWNHPAVLSNLKETLLRSRYGGTLDLLSTNYARGELFLPNLLVYARHLWESFSPVGLLAAGAGLAALFRSDARVCLGTLACYWWSGPVFLFLANMPPNPHALAIVEPHYLASDLILAVWAGRGIGALSHLAGKPGQAAAWVAAAAMAAVPFAMGLGARMDRREHVFSYDYAKNALKSVPPGGVLVAKKDVQLYTLWHHQVTHGWRPDVRVVAQGLAGSPWYRESWRRRDPSLTLTPLRDPTHWERFVAANKDVLASPDAEVPPEIRPRRQEALLTVLGGPPASPGPAAAEAFLKSWELLVLRGDYRYEDQPDFFTSDIVGDYSRALYFAAEEASRSDARPAADKMLERSWALHWLFPEAATLLAYNAFAVGDHVRAKPLYETAARLFNEMLRLADQYHSLPGLKIEISRGAAETWMHLGVMAERSGDSAEAQQRYAESLRLHPMAQTHYNMAVLFWNKDWARVEAELTAALALDPGHAEAARFLALLRAKKR